jgi:hypothetical protein
VGVCMREGARALRISASKLTSHYLIHGSSPPSFMERIHHLSCGTDILHAAWCSHGSEAGRDGPQEGSSWEWNLTDDAFPAGVLCEVTFVLP